MNDKSIFNNNSLIIPFIFFIAIFAELFLFNQSSDVRYAILIFLWFIIGRTLRLQSNATFILTLALLGGLFFYFIINKNSPITERIATWIYFFLWVGVIQQIIELRKIPNKNSS